MRSRTHRYSLAVIILLTLGGAAFSTALPFAYGLIQGSCAPWDGPAIGITLTAEPAQCDRVKGPYISMGVWRGLPIHAGQTVKFGSGSDAGFASRCAKEGDCQRAESGIMNCISRAAKQSKEILMCSGARLAQSADDSVVTVASDTRLNSKSLLAPDNPDALW
jgi:hypothetical protein